MHRALATCLVFVPLAACSGSHATTGDAGPLVDATPDGDAAHALDVAADVPPPPYDAGSAPACSITATARHIVDRPGGDRAADPAGLVAVPSGGFLVGLRHVDLDPPDGGIADGGVVPTSRDSIDLLALAPDGTPRGPATSLFDGAPLGNRTNGPVLLPNAAGAFALFQETHGMASDPSGFVLRVRGGVVDATGTGTSGTVREDFTLPTATTMANGTMLAIGSAISNPTDAGVVTAVPSVFGLLPDGGNTAPMNVDLTSAIPFDAADGVLRARDDGGAVYVYRNAGRPSFLRFGADGLYDPHGAYTAATASVPSLDDAAEAGGAVFVVYAHAGAGGMTEVHAIVMDAATGALRADQLLESFGDAPASIATVVPAYGGVAVLWKRGGDADASVHGAVVQPDGIVRVAATQLVATAHADGRVAAVVYGRAVSFVMRDGASPAWGYTFGQACLGSGM